MDASDIKLIVELLPYYGITSQRSKIAADRLVRECNENGVTPFQDTLGFNEGILYRVFMGYGMPVEDAKRIDSALSDRCIAMKFHRACVQPAHDKFEAWNSPNRATVEVSCVKQKIKDFETKCADVGDEFVEYGYLAELLNELENAASIYQSSKIRLFNEKILVSALHRKLSLLSKKLKTFSKPQRRSNVSY